MANPARQPYVVCVVCTGREDRKTGSYFRHHIFEDIVVCSSCVKESERLGGGLRKAKAAEGVKR